MPTRVRDLDATIVVRRGGAGAPTGLTPTKEANSLRDRNLHRVLLMSPILE
jgi:hypothetical protein